MMRLLSALCAVLLLSLVVASAFAADRPLPAISTNENREPAGTLKAGVLTLRLELREGRWHPGSPDGRSTIGDIPGVVDTYAFAEEGHAPQLPGPLIRVVQGTELQVSVHNTLPVALFVHGLDTHPVKAANVLQLAPGETRQVRFAAGEPGTYLYWASTTPADILFRPDSDEPMSGAFIVDAPGASTSENIYVIQLWTRDLFHPEFQGVLTMNGKSWPYTQRVHAKVGEVEHWRVINASRLPHPMHLHGFYFHVDAVGDGASEHHYTEAERRLVVTESVLPGHSFDMSWVPERAGNWIFHCHIFDHMASATANQFLFGPGAPPASVAEHHHDDNSADGMGMAKLVIGITVSDDPKLTPAKAVIADVGDEKHLFARERPASTYVPAGPGFYLDGVSKKVGEVGPPLVIIRGVRTAITVTNELNEPTAVHWHGLEIESYYDGVAGWTGTTQKSTPSIAPGSAFVAYMTPPRAGTFIYHTHWHNDRQLAGGMYGALLVLEPGQKFDPATDKIFILGRRGQHQLKDPLVLNGSPQPGTMVLLVGQTYRFRLINITPNDAEVATSLQLDGRPVQWRAVAKDGADLPPQQATVRDAVEHISVGETYDFEFAPKMPGEYELRFCAPLGGAVTQVVLVVPPTAPVSVYAAQR